MGWIYPQDGDGVGLPVWQEDNPAPRATAVASTSPWEQYTGGVGGIKVPFSQIANQLASQYGIPVNDLYSAFEKYTGTTFTPITYPQDGDGVSTVPVGGLGGPNARNMDWWGPSAMKETLIRAYGQEHPESPLASWQPDAAFLQQKAAEQSQLGAAGTAGQQRGSSNLIKQAVGFLGEAAGSGALLPLAFMEGGFLSNLLSGAGGALGAAGTGGAATALSAADSALLDASLGGLGAAGTGVASILNPASTGTSLLQGITPENSLGVGTGLPELGGQGSFEALSPGGYLTQGGIASSGYPYFDQALLGTAASGLGSAAAGSAGVGASGGVGAGTSAGAAGAAGTAAGSAAGSALSRILDGTATTADWLSIAGVLGATGLGMYGANQQSNALTGIANQARQDRAPFLNAATNMLNDPTGWAQSGPAQFLAKEQWQQLSPMFGNPAGAPAAQETALNAGMKNYGQFVNMYGNLGLGNQPVQMDMQAKAAGVQGQGMADLGWGLENIFNPKPQGTTLADIARLIGNKSSLT